MRQPDSSSRDIPERIERLTAWPQLRSSGRQGSAVADDLIAFSDDNTWQRPIVDYGRLYASKVESDYQAFVRTQKERQ